MLTIQDYSAESLVKCQSALNNARLSSDSALSLRVEEASFARGLEIDVQEFAGFCSQLDDSIRNGTSLSGTRVNQLINTELPAASTRSKILLCQLIHDLDYRQRCIADPENITVTPYEDKIGKRWNIASHSSLGARSFKPVPQIKTYNCFPNALAFIENRAYSSYNEVELLDLINEAAQELFVASKYEKGLSPTLNENLFHATTDADKIELVRNLTIGHFVKNFFVWGSGRDDSLTIKSAMLLRERNYLAKPSYWHLINIFLEQFNAKYQTERLLPINEAAEMTLPEQYRTADRAIDWDKVCLDAYDYLASFSTEALHSKVFFKDYDRAVLAGVHVAKFAARVYQKLKDQFPTVDKAYNFAIVLDLGDDFYTISFGNLICHAITDDQEDLMSDTQSMKRRLFYDNYCVDHLRLTTRNGEKKSTEAGSFYRGSEYKRQQHGILVASRNLFFKDKELDWFWKDAVKTYTQSAPGETRDRALVAAALKQADPDYEQNIVLISKLSDNDSDNREVLEMMPSPQGLVLV